MRKKVTPTGEEKAKAKAKVKTILDSFPVIKQIYQESEQVPRQMPVDMIKIRKVKKGDKYVYICDENGEELPFAPDEI
jgi:hypothetical protein